MFKMQSSDKSPWEYERELKEWRKAQKNKRRNRKGKKDRWNDGDDEE